MHFFHSLLVQAAAAVAVKLYIAETNGNVTTLALTQSHNSYSLSVAHRTLGCLPNPSVLIHDSANKVLYCLDRGVTSSTNGSLNSFSISDSGNLTRIARVNAPLSVVSGTIFGEGGKRGIATASYNRSAYSVIGLGDKGALTEPLQIFFPVMATPGPTPLRQDRSYLHEAIVDPTKRYLIMPDLGADMIRVFTWDKKTLAPLKELAPLLTDAGVGPRHGVFWYSPSRVLHYIFVGELNQRVYSYKITYAAAGGITWTQVYSMPGLGFENERPRQTSPQSEIALTPDNKYVIVSHRDVSFASSTIYQSGPTDTLSTLKIHSNGTLSLHQLAPSGGWSPRQFSLNKKGDMLAVGHQNNQSVVVWKRDVSTGLIVTGSPAAQITLSGPVVVALWDESC